MWGVCLGTLAGLADCKLRCQLHLGKCGYKYAFVSRGSQSRISWLEIWVMERVRPVTVPRLREVSLPWGRQPRAMAMPAGGAALALASVAWERSDVLPT